MNHGATGVYDRAAQTTVVQRDLARLRDMAGRIVGSTFFGTLLKTMRESTIQGVYGHGGRGEEVFAAQLHELLAERLGTALQPQFQGLLYTPLAQQQRSLSARRATGAGVTTGS